MGAEKRDNKSNESNQNLRIFAKTKDVFPIPIFADEDISQRPKYELENLVIYVNNYLSKNFNFASIKASVGLLLTIS